MLVASPRHSEYPRQVVTVNARYVMHNASDEPLQYGQRGSRTVWQLAPGASTPFHWFAHDILATP